MSSVCHYCSNINTSHMGSCRFKLQRKHAQAISAFLNLRTEVFCNLKIEAPKSNPGGGSLSALSAGGTETETEPQIEESQASQDEAVDSLLHIEFGAQYLHISAGNVNENRTGRCNTCTSSPPPLPLTSPGGPISKLQKSVASGRQAGQAGTGHNRHLRDCDG